MRRRILVGLLLGFALAAGLALVGFHPPADNAQCPDRLVYACRPTP